MREINTPIERYYVLDLTRVYDIYLHNDRLMRIAQAYINCQLISRKKQISVFDPSNSG